MCVFNLSFKLSLQIERLSHVTMQLDFGQWAALNCLKLMIRKLYISELPAWSAYTVCFVNVFILDVIVSVTKYTYSVTQNVND